jgi:hypothetical protein
MKIFEAFHITFISLFPTLSLIATRSGHHRSPIETSEARADASGARAAHVESDMSHDDDDDDDDEI